MSFFCGMERTEYSGFFLIAADYRWMNLLQKLLQLPLTKGASTYTYRIEDDRMTKLIGSLPGKNARSYFAFVRNSGIKKGSLTEGGDLSSLLFILCHYSTSAGRKKNICNIIHSDRIGQTVDLGMFF